MITEFAFKSIVLGLVTLIIFVIGEVFIPEK